MFNYFLIYCYLLVYLILVFTFGFSLLILEIAIGRKTKVSSINAYEKLNKKFGWMGILSLAIPVLILPYYSVIGGWVIKYMTVYMTVLFYFYFILKICP